VTCLKGVQLHRLGIDLTGGDRPADQYFDAIMRACNQVAPSCAFYFFAHQQSAAHFSLFIQSSYPSLFSRVTFHPVAETIAMGDHPLGAIRRKRNSSLVVGMRMLKKKQLDAFLSCGNTGALIASAALSLPMLPGISRPALLAALPTSKGPLAVVDVGGNLSCKAHNLIQFALLGAAYQSALHGIAAPKIGLLNVGAESKKGTAEVCQAYQLLKAQCQNRTAVRFIGNVEGRDIFNGDVDVLVTDGFTGNVLLKTAEGVAAFIFDKLAKTAHGSGAFMQAFQELQSQFNYQEYPGAIVCGVEGVVIKIHGSASPKTLYNSILSAAEAVQNQHVALMKEKLQGFLAI
jgi:phosphate acyltransferase